MKTKPFNLEEALNGAKVVTRNGDEVTQLHKFNVKKFHCLCGVLDEDILSWTINGEFWDKENNHSRDLLLVVEPKKFWVNMYQDELGEVYLGQKLHTTKREPEAWKCKDGYIKTIEITDEDEK